MKKPPPGQPIATLSKAIEAHEKGYRILFSADKGKTWESLTAAQMTIDELLAEEFFKMVEYRLDD